MRTFSDNLLAKCHGSSSTGIKGILIAAGALALAPGLLLAHGGDDKDGDHHGKRGACSTTAKLALKACRAEGRDDLLIATANCLNVSDRDERRTCQEDAQADNSDFLDLCREQYDARLDVCDLVGEGPYDPDFADGNFADGDQDPLGGNTWFPLAVGNRWIYKSTFDQEDDEGNPETVTETITVRVLGDEYDATSDAYSGAFVTKDIDGVTCLVVNDRVEEEVNNSGEKEVIEDTDDWYARNLDTNDVWYCGELARDFETFHDDSPPLPELVSIDGSFKAGRDGDKAGILAPELTDPAQGYRQEFSLGNAEDVVEVLSVNYVFGGSTSDDPESLDYLVPAELGAKFCSATPCRVTRDFSPLQPGVDERKYYAQNIGVVLEVNLADGTTTELVEYQLH